MKDRASMTLSLLCSLGIVFGVANGFAADIDPVAARHKFHPQAAGAAKASAQKSAASTMTYGPVFHNGATLNCADCHVMHASKQHAVDGSTSPDAFGAYAQTFTPTSKLLKATDPVALCLMCHDNKPGIPDVMGADVNGLADRPAGFFGDVNVPNPRGHNIAYGVSANENDICDQCHWGGMGASSKVTCLNCHNPHGNGAPRNLQWASYTAYAPTLSYFIRDGQTGIGRYQSNNVGYGAIDGNTPAITSICIDCHHAYFSPDYTDSRTGGSHIRHPNNNLEWGYDGKMTHDSTGCDLNHWTSGSGAGFNAPRVPFVVNGAASFAASKTVARDNAVFCLSCHKAHGSGRAYGLTWDPNGGTNGLGCEQCHNRSGL